MPKEAHRPVAVGAKLAELRLEASSCTAAAAASHVCTQASLLEECRKLDEVRVEAAAAAW